MKSQIIKEVQKAMNDFLPVIIICFVIPLVIGGIVVACVIGSKKSPQGIANANEAKERANAAVERYINHEVFQKIIKRVSNLCLKDILYAHGSKLNTVQFTIRINPHGICINPFRVYWNSPTNKSEDIIIRFQEYNMVDIFDATARHYFELAFQKQFAENINAELNSKGLTPGVHYKIMVKTSSHDEKDELTEIFKDYPQHERQEMAIDANRSRYLYYAIAFGYEKNEW
jgi:hypothetical protein